MIKWIDKYLSKRGYVKMDRLQSKWATDNRRYCPTCHRVTQHSHDYTLFDPYELVTEFVGEDMVPVIAAKIRITCNSCKNYAFRDVKTVGHAYAKHPKPLYTFKERVKQLNQSWSSCFSLLINPPEEQKFN